LNLLAKWILPRDREIDNKLGRHRAYDLTRNDEGEGRLS
jgi:hypothetical protein